MSNDDEKKNQDDEKRQNQSDDGPRQLFPEFSMYELDPIVVPSDLKLGSDNDDEDEMEAVNRRLIEKEKERERLEEEAKQRAEEARKNAQLKGTGDHSIMPPMPSKDITSTGSFTRPASPPPRPQQGPKHVIKPNKAKADSPEAKAADTKSSELPPTRAPNLKQRLASLVQKQPPTSAKADPQPASAAPLDQNATHDIIPPQSEIDQSMGKSAGAEAADELEQLILLESAHAYINPESIIDEPLPPPAPEPEPDPDELLVQLQSFGDTASLELMDFEPEARGAEPANGSAPVEHATQPVVEETPAQDLAVQEQIVPEQSGEEQPAPEAAAEPVAASEIPTVEAVQESAAQAVEEVVTAEPSAEAPPVVSEPEQVHESVPEAPVAEAPAPEAEPASEAVVESVVESVAETATPEAPPVESPPEEVEEQVAEAPAHEQSAEAAQEAVHESADEAAGETQTAEPSAEVSQEPVAETIPEAQETVAEEPSTQQPVAAAGAEPAQEPQVEFAPEAVDQHVDGHVEPEHTGSEAQEGLAKPSNQVPGNLKSAITQSGRLWIHSLFEEDEDEDGEKAPPAAQPGTVNSDVPEAQIDAPQDYIPPDFPTEESFSTESDEAPLQEQEPSAEQTHESAPAEDTHAEPVATAPEAELPEQAAEPEPPSRDSVAQTLMELPVIDLSVQLGADIAMEVAEPPAESQQTEVEAPAEEESSDLLQKPVDKAIAQIMFESVDPIQQGIPEVAPESRESGEQQAFQVAESFPTEESFASEQPEQEAHPEPTAESQGEQQAEGQHSLRSSAGPSPFNAWAEQSEPEQIAVDQQEQTSPDLSSQIAEGNIRSTGELPQRSEQMAEQTAPMQFDAQPEGQPAQPMELTAEQQSGLATLELEPISIRKLLDQEGAPSPFVEVETDQFEFSPPHTPEELKEAAETRDGFDSKTSIYELEPITPDDLKLFVKDPSESTWAQEPIQVEAQPPVSEEFESSSSPAMQNEQTVAAVQEPVHDTTHGADQAMLAETEEYNRKREEEEQNTFKPEQSIYELEPFVLPSPDQRLHEDWVPQTAQVTSLEPPPVMPAAVAGSHEKIPSFMRTAPDPLLGTVLAGKYEFIDVIGQGGMAIVYRARQLSDDHLVAIKTLKAPNPADTVRFIQEIKTHSQLRHRNIVGFVDSVTNDVGQCFLVMERVKGISLQEILRSLKRLDNEENIADILNQVLTALDYAHRVGVIHRDLKSGNIIMVKEVDDDMVVKILDFGIAKVQGDDMQRITHVGQALGSPIYMSPEQCSGKDLTNRSDLYSLGVVAYEMVTGVPPYWKGTLINIMSAHCTESIRPAPLMETAPHLAGCKLFDQIIQKALETDPIKRWQTAGHFKNAVEFWLRSCLAGNPPDELPLEFLSDTGPQHVIEPQVSMKATLEQRVADINRHEANLRNTPVTGKVPSVGPFATAAENAKADRGDPGGPLSPPMEARRNRERLKQQIKEDQETPADQPKPADQVKFAEQFKPAEKERPQTRLTNDEINVLDSIKSPVNFNEPIPPIDRSSSSLSKSFTERGSRANTDAPADEQSSLTGTVHLRRRQAPESPPTASQTMIKVVIFVVVAIALTAGIAIVFMGDNEQLRKDWINTSKSLYNSVMGGGSSTEPTDQSSNTPQTPAAPTQNGTAPTPDATAAPGTQTTPGTAPAPATTDSATPDPSKTDWDTQ